MNGEYPRILPVMILCWSFGIFADLQEIEIEVEQEQTQASKKRSDVIIVSSLLDFLDGMNYGIHAGRYGLNVQARTLLHEMLYSEIYNFEGKKYSIKTFTLLERKAPESLRVKLKQALEMVKRDFVKKFEPFMDSARGFKKQMYTLIRLSCELHRRNDSLLLTWAEAKEGEDTKAFETHTRSFQDLARFFIDLKNFLDDLLSSCPKAKQLFLQEISNEKQRAQMIIFLDTIFEEQKVKIGRLRTQTEKL